LASKFAKSAEQTANFCLSQQFNMYQKNAEFDTDFESIEKVEKQVTEKS
jgi:hypothetical protein